MSLVEQIGTDSDVVPLFQFGLSVSAKDVQKTAKSNKFGCNLLSPVV